MLVAASKVTHHDARQAVFALEPDQPVGEYGEGQEVDAGTVRYQVAPMRAIRGRKSGATAILKSSAPSALVRMNSAGAPPNDG